MVVQFFTFRGKELKAADSISDSKLMIRLQVYVITDHLIILFISIIILLLLINCPILMHMLLPYLRMKSSLPMISNNGLKPFTTVETKERLSVSSMD